MLEQNFDVITSKTHVPIKTWTHGVPLEDQAKAQLVNVASLPFIYKWVAVMPDVHLGMGVTIGSVIPTIGAVMPAAIGVDIGCGMMAQKTTLTIRGLETHGDLKKIRNSIERAIPHGRTNNGGPGDRGAWGKPPKIVKMAWAELDEEFHKICFKHPKIAQSNNENHLGTLGSGNHFIEICIDERDKIWIMLHSGSRGVGGKIGSYFIRLAKSEMKRWYIELPDVNLAYFPEGSQYFDDYIQAANWAQEFARINRELMMHSAIDTLLMDMDIPRFELAGEAINCHHNYVCKEHHYGKNVWVTRKGAVRARSGELGIIPGCLAKGTRILTSNGFYKNIETICVGDKIIAGDGTVTTVTKTFNRGEKPTWSYVNNNFHLKTQVTPDHLHFIGDLTTVARSYLKTGYVNSLEAPTLNGKSKYHWSSLEKTSGHFTFLCPKNIRFEIPNIFEYDDSHIQISCKSGESIINYDIGYIIGTYLGDGSSFYSSAKGGQTSWAFNISEKKIVQKMSTALLRIGFPSKVYERDNVILVVVHNVYLAKMFKLFGTRQNKNLPEQFWCKDLDFLRGLYDGLIDSDGHTNNETKKLTNTSRKIIELFGITHYLLFGYFPSVSIREPSAGGLKNCNVANCFPSFRSTSLKNPNAMLTSNYQIIKRLSLLKDTIDIETFDIEVAHKDHSFIANNVIVHNSMGTKSYIVRGLGNAESFHSCSHGAGRLMSRTAAKKKFTLKDHERATEGVECNKGMDVLDETPGAYKPIDAVMEAQKDLVEPIHTLKQIICVKG